MIINWLGQNCFKIEAKNATIIIDPVSYGGNLKMAKTSTDILVLPRPVAEKDLLFLKTPAFVIKVPGEYESKGIFVEGQVFGGHSAIVFRLEIEGIRIGHLSMTSQLDEETAGFLEGVDVP